MNLRKILPFLILLISFVWIFSGCINNKDTSEIFLLKMKGKELAIVYDFGEYNEILCYYQTIDDARHRIRMCLLTSELEYAKRIKDTTYTK